MNDFGLNIRRKLRIMKDSFGQYSESVVSEIGEESLWKIQY